jgi:hypothetical protein
MEVGSNSVIGAVVEEGLIPQLCKKFRPSVKLLKILKVNLLTLPFLNRWELTPKMLAIRIPDKTPNCKVMFKILLFPLISLLLWNNEIILPYFISIFGRLFARTLFFV